MKAEVMIVGRNAKEIYINGRKTFTKIDDGENGEATFVPMTLRQYRKIRTGATEDDYVREIMSWWSIAQKELSVRCTRQWEEKVCYEEVEKVSKRASRELSDEIGMKCRATKNHLHW